MKYVISDGTEVQKSRAPRPARSDFDSSHDDQGTVVSDRGGSIVCRLFQFTRALSIDRLSDCLIDSCERNLAVSSSCQSSPSPAGCLCEADSTKRSKVRFQHDANYPRRAFCFTWHVDDLTRFVSRTSFSLSASHLPNSSLRTGGRAAISSFLQSLNLTSICSRAVDGLLMSKNSFVFWSFSIWGTSKFEVPIDFFLHGSGRRSPRQWWWRTLPEMSNQSCSRHKFNVNKSMNEVNTEEGVQSSQEILLSCGRRIIEAW